MQQLAEQGPTVRLLGVHAHDIVQILHRFDCISVPVTEHDAWGMSCTGLLARQTGLHICTAMVLLLLSLLQDENAWDLAVACTVELETLLEGQGKMNFKNIPALM